MKSRLSLVGFGLFLAACVETRNEPTPHEMCRELAQACEGLSISSLDTCYEIGAAGLKDSRNEDRCYAAYDDCLAECVYYSNWSGDAGDSGGATPLPGLDADVILPQADATPPVSSTDAASPNEGDAASLDASQLDASQLDATGSDPVQSDAAQSGSDLLDAAAEDAAQLDATLDAMPLDATPLDAMQSDAE